MASDNLLELTDQNFEQEVVKSEIPALVDFWAEWCMPCKMQTPTVEELAKEYGGRLKVGSLDTDFGRDTAIKYGISAIPTLLLFRGGEVVKKLVGLRPKAALRQVIDEVLG